MTERAASWSPSWQPVRAELDDYRCRHGLGYTVIGGRRAGIDAETLYFVPLGETLEVWRVRITNQRAEDAHLSLFSAVEFCLWDAWDDATNFQRNLSIGEVEVDDGVIYPQHRVPGAPQPLRLLRLLGAAGGVRHAARRLPRPLPGLGAPAGGRVGAVGRLPRPRLGAVRLAPRRAAPAPGETRDVVFVLGYAENPADAKFDPPGSQTIDKRRVRRVIDRYLPVDEVDAAFRRLRDHWDDLLGSLQVATPSEHVDRMVNVWNPYQCMVTFNLSRSASSFESGIGRGMGFRDSNQDLLGFVHMVPERARGRILDIAATQLPTGGAYHQYQPLTKTGQRRHRQRLQRRPAVAHPRASPPT